MKQSVGDSSSGGSLTSVTGGDDETTVAQWRRQGGRGEASAPMGGRPKIM